MDDWRRGGACIHAFSGVARRGKAAEKISA